MNTFINMVLRTGLAYGLHDREAFIHKFSELLKDKVNNEEDLERWGETILNEMENLKSQLTLEQLFSGATKSGNKDLTEKITELTIAVNNLTETIQKQQKS
jgi:hypothetical protein